MKHLKKIMSLILTAIMVIAMCVPVMAAGETCKITAPVNAHEYEIYQIFTGDLNNRVLSNVKWGENGTGKKGEAVAADILDKLSAVNNKSDREILDVVEQYAKLINPVGTVTNGSTYSAAPGYYLIKDKDNSVSSTDAYTTYIVQVVGDVNIQAKSSVPSFEKKLKDKNDTTGETSEWQDSADYDIGDEIPFKLEGTVASKYADYKHYYFAFHDKEEKGLSFNESSVKAYIGKDEIPKNYYTIVTPGSEQTDKCTFEIIFNDLKEIEIIKGVKAVQAGTKIRVEYTSTLNDKAVLGNQGNVNSAKLEFSNNPNSDQTGKPDNTGETPWDNVIVFTYQVVVNKYANSVSEDNRLTGAEFTLEKKIKGKNGAEDTWTPISHVETGKTSVFTFKGLDDGDYRLTETVTPSEFNTISPIEFTVNAEHTINWNTGKRTDLLTGLTGNIITGNITFTADTNKEQLSTDVINKSGSTLPETGGIGTTIFYVVGVVLMLGAGVLLITKRRMSAKH